MFHISLSIVKLQFGMYCSVFYFLTTDWRIGNTNEMSCLVVLKPYFKNFQEINVLFLIKPYWVCFGPRRFHSFWVTIYDRTLRFFDAEDRKLLSGEFTLSNTSVRSYVFTGFILIFSDFPDFFVKILSTTAVNSKNWESTSNPVNFRIWINFLAAFLIVFGWSF